MIKLIALLLISAPVFAFTPKFVYNETVVVKDLVKRLNIPEAPAKFYECTDDIEYRVVNYKQQYLNNEPGCRFGYTIILEDSLHSCARLLHKEMIVCEDSIKKAK